MDPATETAVWRPAPRSWFCSRSTACWRGVQLRLQRRDLGVVLRAQRIGLGVAALARPLREARPEVGLGLPGVRDELLPTGLRRELYGLGLVQPVGVVLRPVRVRLRVARGRRQIVERRAVARRRFEIGCRDGEVGGAVPVDRDRAVGECRQARVVARLVDLRLLIEQPHAGDADQRRHVGERRAGGRGAAQRQIGGATPLGSAGAVAAATATGAPAVAAPGPRARRPRGRRGAAGEGSAAFSGSMSDVICGRESAGRARYDIVQRVWNTSGAFSCTLLSRKTRLPSAQDQLLELAAVEPALARGALESVEHAQLVLLGLQPSDEPRAGVGEPLVVEVDRVLRRQHHAQAERARLLEQRQQRRLRRRVRRPAGSSRRSRPCRAARAGSSCPTVPRIQPRTCVQQQRDEEHPLVVAESGRSRRSTTRGLPALGVRSRPMSSGTPSIQR